MTSLCKTTDIEENHSKGFLFHGKNILAVKLRGEIYLYENSCPHRSIPLEWQPDQFLDYEKTFIQCATHGALFSITTGECIAGPCVGDQLTPISYHIEGNAIFIADNLKE